MKKILLFLVFILSATLSIAQTPPLKGPTAVKGQQIEIDKKNALIEWTASTDTVSGYKIYYSIKGATKTDSIRVGLINSQTLSVPTLDTVYVVKMKSFKAVPGKDTVYSDFTPTVNVIMSKKLGKPMLYLEPASTTQKKILLRLQDTNRYETGLEVKFEGGTGPAIIDTSGRLSGERLINQQNLQPKTKYKITARAKIKMVGDTYSYSEWTEPIYETTKVDVPPQPTNLKKIADCPYGNIISWSIDSRPDDIDLIYVNRSFNGKDFERIATLPSHLRQYTDTGAEPGVYWTYRISTANNTGGANSNDFGVFTKDYVAPSLPVNIRILQGQYDISPNKLTVAWNHGSEDLECRTNILANTEVFYRINEGEYKKLGDFPNYMTQATIEGLNPKDNVEIRLRTFSDKQKISDFTSIYAFTPGPPSIPNNFIGVLNRDRLGDQVLYLSWNKTSDDTEYYKIEKSTDGINFHENAFLLQQFNALPDTKIEEGVTYYYRIKSGNWAGESEFSPIYGPFFVNYSSAPNPPYGLVAKLNGGKVDLSWVDDSIKEEKYILEKSSDGGNTFVKVAELGRDETTFSDENISEGKTFIYRVKATNPLGSSAYSNPRTIVIPAATSSINFEVTVYPNPVADKLSVQVDGYDPATVFNLRIFDSNSNLIYQKSTKLDHSQTFIVPVQSFMPGVYNVTVSNETGTIAKKLIKL